MPSPRPAADGLFLSNTGGGSDNGKLFLVLDGAFRHIVNQVTLNTLFTSDYNVEYWKISNYSSPIGDALGTNTRLVRDLNTGKAYFQHGSLLRHIISSDVASLYHFKIGSAVNIPNLNGYIKGDKILLKSVIEGNLVRSSESKIYIVMHGQTYVAVFGTNPPITNVSYIYNYLSCR